MTRVAGANPRIWVDIFLDNADELQSALADHRRRVEQLESALAAGDAGFLARWIAEAAGNRRRMLEREYAEPGELQRSEEHTSELQSHVNLVRRLLLEKKKNDRFRS